MIQPQTIRVYNPPHDPRITEVTFTVRNLNHATFIPRYEYRATTDFKKNVVTMSIIDHVSLTEIVRIRLPQGNEADDGTIFLIMPASSDEDFVEDIHFNDKDNFSAILASALKKVIPNDYHHALIVQQPKAVPKQFNNG